jgi:hypothetical protein
MDQHEQHDHIEDIPSNESGNRPFEEVLRVNMGRRKLLKSGATLAGGAAIGFTGVAQAETVSRALLRFNEPLIGFTSVTLAQGAGPEPAVAPEYDYTTILPWGDPIKPSGPAFSLPMTSSNQEQQIGIGHDGMWYFPILDPNAPRFGWDAVNESNPWVSGYLSEYGVPGYGDLNGVMCFNCEFGTNSHVLRKDQPESLEDVRVSQHAHGVTVVQLRSVNGVWTTQESALARRIHVNTPMDFSGPAASHPMLQNAAMNEPAGTVNNCANGYTPWGTYLTCEENFNGYFGTEDASWTRSANQARLGISSGGFGYGWHKFDPRFDIANPDYAGEHNRFGWVVEIDPFDPDAKPIKRTALGRKKNECASVTVSSDGRAVVYMGDDERFDYVYKFVSAEPWREMRANGESPLDRGTLYVAKFNDNGSGDWLELSLENPALASAFTDMGTMMVMARAAADLVGATPMDRPEWITVAPDGRVYVACTNNSRRTEANVMGEQTGRTIDTGPNAANPNPNNSDGHIIRWIESRSHSGNKFEWEIVIFAKDTHGTEASFADPDGIWADPDGRIFVQTDGGQKDGLQNQMLVGDPGTGEIKRLFTGVPGCEITGMAVTPNRRTMFINVQHPGNGDPESTSFPAATGSGAIPRDATVVITKKDGGVVGS